MIQYHVFPGGKKRIVTFSYDDGHKNDERLIEIFNRYGVKATFHLNGGKYRNLSGDELAAKSALYAGHEISCHTVSHGWPTRMPPASLLREVAEDRQILEKIAGYPVLGHSYPCGDYNSVAEDVLRSCGIVYSRTTQATKLCHLPENFLAWNPTCHHRDALPLCRPFLDTLDSEWGRPLFYIWGHSHELRTEEDWRYMESVVAMLSGNDKIWYATNMEIYRYITAQHRLEISFDETIFYNPSDIAVWVEKDKKQLIEIPAGKTVRIQNS